MYPRVPGSAAGLSLDQEGNMIKPPLLLLKRHRAICHSERRCQTGSAVISIYPIMHCAVYSLEATT